MLRKRLAVKNPLGERIRIRRKIPPLTEESFRVLTEHYGISADEKVVKIALERNVRTLELDLLLFMAVEAGIRELDVKTFKALLKKLREEGLS